MKTGILAFSGLAVLLAVLPACSDSSSSTNPSTTKRGAAALSGSYELSLTVTSATGSGDKSRTIRLDLLPSERAPGLIAWTQATGQAIKRNALTVKDEAIDLEWTDASTSTYQRLNITRTSDGRLDAVSGKLGGAAVEEVIGKVGRDGTAPTLLQAPATLPWETGTVGFSEALLLAKITLPKNDQLGLDLIPVPESPWISGISITSRSWESWPLSLPLAAKDAAGNALTGEITVPFVKVGPAVSSYDFARDEPAWRSEGAKLGPEDCQRGRCLHLASGPDKIALHIVSAKIVPEMIRVMSLHVRAFTSGAGGAPPDEIMPLLLLVVPRSGAKPVVLGNPKMAWEASGSAGVKAFTTEFTDIDVPLPEVESEIGVTLSLGTLSKSPGQSFALVLEKVSLDLKPKPKP